MFEEKLYSKGNRRTRGERTKRRERYLLLSSASKINYSELSIESGISSSSESLTSSVENNNSSVWQRPRTPHMGNNLLVDILSLLLF